MVPAPKALASGFAKPPPSHSTQWLLPRPPCDGDAPPLPAPPSQSQGLEPLAEKLAGSHNAEHPPPRFPSLLSRLARMLPCYDPPSMATLAKNTYSGPFLQGVLRAVAGDRWAQGGCGSWGVWGLPAGAVPCSVRALWRHSTIVCGGGTKLQGEEVLQERLASVAAFGTPLIARRSPSQNLF